MQVLRGLGGTEVQQNGQGTAAQQALLYVDCRLHCCYFIYALKLEYGRQQSAPARLSPITACSAAPPGLLLGIQNGAWQRATGQCWA